MKINVKFNAILKQWLDKDPEDRDLALGAHLLLRLDGNYGRYMSRINNPEAASEEIEQKLQQYYERRASVDSEEKIEEIKTEAKKILSEQIKEAVELKSGKRADHDSLPEEIQNLYVENAEIRRRMQQLNLEIRNLLNSKASCAPEDLAQLCKLLKAEDVKYHDNWNKYDSFVISSE